MGISSRLSAFASQHGPTSVAIVGAGSVGCGVLNILQHCPATRPQLIVNRHVDKAIAALKALGISRRDIVISDDRRQLLDALASGRYAVTSDHALLETLPVNIVIEATGAIDYGTRVILAALRAGQHVISFNAEVDALLAWRFHQEASSHGVVYTIADGDQPGAQFRLAEDLDAMGFDISVMLNCKRHLDIHQNPSTGAGYAARDTISSVMTTAFGDGTKMQIEQAVVANATGLVPAKRGMHGIESTVNSLLSDASALWPAQAGGASQNNEGEQIKGYVDFTLGGDFGPGIGIIARHQQEGLHDRAMSFYKMGNGPDYFFFRPYHLVHLELPLTVADILLHGEPLASVEQPHVAAVVSMSKKDLTAGEQLDGIGGYCAYGLIDRYKDALELLPIALSQYATLKVDVAQDTAIALADVELDETSVVVQEWKAQAAQSAN